LHVVRRDLPDLICLLGRDRSLGSAPRAAADRRTKAADQQLEEEPPPIGEVETAHDGNLLDRNHRSYDHDESKGDGLGSQSTPASFAGSRINLMSASRSFRILS